MDEVVREMGRRCYGYGSWEAPYWFIGPEQGQARDENNDLKPRVDAWRRLGGGELNDCRDFHALIGEKRWHQGRPRLQSTWRPLMLLLMSFLGRPTDNESLRRYQRDEWGTLNGETCVIELSGLAAHSFKIERDRECFREERIRVIRERIHHYMPALVVMYGVSEKRHWEAITGQAFPSESIVRIGRTIVVFALHPTTHGLTNTYWEQLGAILRQFAQTSLTARTSISK
jgi:hypothetical protein